MSEQNNQAQQNKIKDYWPMISLLLVVLIMVIGYYVIYPNMRTLKELNIQIAAKETEAKALDEKIAGLSLLSKSFGQNQAKIDKFNVAFPKNDDMPKILNAVSVIAAETGLIINSVNQQKATKNDPYTPVEIGFSGSFKALSLFLEGLEKNIRPSSPKEITITSGSSQQEENQNLISGKIDLDFFKVAGLNNSDEKTSESQSAFSE